MCGIGDEIAVLAKMVGNLIEKRIDFSRQLIQLIADPAQLKPLFQVTWTQSLCRLDQTLQWLNRSFSQQQSAERSQQQNGQTDGSKNSSQSVDVFFDELHQRTDADFVTRLSGAFQFSFDRAMLIRGPD